MTARIKVRDVLAAEGIVVPASVRLTDHDGAMEALERWSMDGIVPACCEDGCEVEPDGICEHGHPSVLMALGLL